MTMKKGLILIGLLALTLPSARVQAQVPTLHFGDSGYMYNPAWFDTIRIHDYYSRAGITTDPTFYGNAYHSGDGFTMYGVTMVSDDFMEYPYLWVIVLKDDTLSNGHYAFDTIKAELFCFIDSPAVTYANFEIMSTPPNTEHFTAPLYNFYFREPVEIPAGIRFYAGVSHAEYNAYNLSYYGKAAPDHYWPYSSFHRFHFWSWKLLPGFDPSTYPGYDGRDSTWWLCLPRNVSEIDWRTADANNKYMASGYFPILAPADRHIRQNHIHDEPLTATVPTFHLEAVRDNALILAWDSVESGWGRVVGADVDLFEVQYALYDGDYDSVHSIITDRFSLTVRDTFSQQVYYKARIRCRNHHRCDIHDTLVWGPWSREVYFRLSNTQPDCSPVENFRFLGERMNRPYFSWDRRDGQSVFEIQCAPYNSDTWSGTIVEDRSSCVLPRGFQQAGTYKARIHAKCPNQYLEPDSVLWSPWSDLAVFYSSGQWTEADTGEVGIAAPEVTTTFTLSPNPTTGMVTVMLPPLSEGAVLTVADATGREVRRQTLPPTAETTRLRLDLKGLPAGAYFVTVATPQGSHTEKLVISGQ